MNDAVETFTALTYIIPGMPLIYNGQEYDLKKRLKFFEKDTIPHTIGKMMNVYQKLGKLKVDNPALDGGKTPASYKRISTSDDLHILAFEREKKRKKVIFVGNLSRNSRTFSMPLQGNYFEYLTGSKETFSEDQKITLKPWEYKILILN
jgi:1,4-alpha-glucan branching enzyme